MNQDTVANLYDFPAREYNDIHGRWPSPDPAGISAVRLRNPQTWNRYAYVNNSPLSHTDPSGMDPLDMGPCLDGFCDDGSGYGTLQNNGGGGDDPPDPCADASACAPPGDCGSLCSSGNGNIPFPDPNSASSIPVLTVTFAVTICPCLNDAAVAELGPLQNADLNIAEMEAINLSMSAPELYAGAEAVFDTAVGVVGALSPAIVVFGSNVLAGYQMATGDNPGSPQTLGQWIGYAFGLDDTLFPD